MDGKVIQVTIVHLKPGIEDLVLPDLASLVEATRQNSGCLSFDIYRLVKDPNLWVLQETWETEEAHKAYAFSPLKVELTNLLLQSTSKPMETLDVEELCLHSGG